VLRRVLYTSHTYRTPILPYYLSSLSFFLRLARRSIKSSIYMRKGLLRQGFFHRFSSYAVLYCTLHLPATHKHLGCIYYYQYFHNLYYFPSELNRNEKKKNKTDQPTYRLDQARGKCPHMHTPPPVIYYRTCNVRMHLLLLSSLLFLPVVVL